MTKQFPKEFFYGVVQQLPINLKGREMLMDADLLPQIRHVQ